MPYLGNTTTSFNVDSNNINNGSITTEKIAAGAVVNADVNDSASIAGTKISADFGAQDLIVDTNLLFVDVSEDRVGVGTSSPTGKLDVAGSLGTVRVQDSGANLEFTRDGGNTILASGTNGEFFFQTGGTNTRMFISKTGEIGIGTNVLGSSAKFEVKSTTGSITSATSRINGGGTTTGAIDTGASLLFAGHDGVNGRDFASLFAGKENGTSGNHDAYLAFGTRVNSGSVTEKLRITSSGRVGIGTSSPARGPLHVHATSGESHLHLTNADTGATDGDGFSVVALTSTDNNEAWLIQRENAAMRFYTNSFQRASIDNSGRFLVGLSSNSANTTLALQGSSSDSSGVANLRLLRGAANPTAASKLGNIIFSDGQNQEGVVLEGSCDSNWSSGSSFPSRFIVKVTPSGGTTPVEHTRFREDGTLILGETTNASIMSGSPEYVFALGQATNSSGHDSGCVQVRSVGDGGRVSFISNVVYNNHFNFYWRTNIAGSITSPNSNSVSYNTSSDYRLKENVVPLTGAIDRVNQLQVHRFNFIASPDSTVDGFMAHEAQTVVPECATGFKDEVDDDGNPVYQGIDQSKLVPLLTAALQEAIGEIESLKTRVAALEAN